MSARDRLAALRHPRVAGLAGIAAVVALAAVVVLLSTATFGQRTVTAVVEHSAGLRVGEEVQVAGVGVGEVTDIRLTDEAVAVEFTIERSVPLGSRTQAAVKVATLLGTHYLEVVPAGAGGLSDDTIPLARTSVPFNLQDVIEGTQETLTELDEATLAEAMATVAGVLDRTPEETQAAVAGVAVLSQTAATRTARLQELLDASGSVTGQLVDHQDQILALLDDTALVLQELTARQQVIDALLIDGQALAQEVTGLLDDTAADLDPLMTGLTAALQNLRDTQDSIMTAMTSLSQMATYVANSSGNGPWVDLHVPVAIPDNLGCLPKAGECS